MKKTLLLFSALFLLAGLISCERGIDTDSEPDPQSEPLVPAFTQGDVFYSDTDGDIYWLHDPEGTATIKKIHENSNKTIKDIFIDQKTNKIYLADFFDSKILVSGFDGVSNLKPTEFISTVQPQAFAFQEKNGERILYVVTQDPKLKEVNLNTKAAVKSEFDVVVDPINGVAVDDVNKTFYIRQHDQIHRIQTNPKDFTTILSNDVIGDGNLEVDPKGNRLFWVDKFSQHLKQSDLNGNNVKGLGNAGNDDSRAVSYDPVKNAIYYANPNAEGKLIKRDLATNKLKQFNTTKIRAIAVVE